MRRKRILIAIGVLIIAVILCGIIMKIFSKRNQTDEVVLSTNAGIAYEWKCKIEDETIAKVSKTYKEEVDPELDGGEILVHYIIKGKKAGITKFYCNFSDTNDNTIEANTYNISVDKKLNVNITNSD